MCVMRKGNEAMRTLYRRNVRTDDWMLTMTKMKRRNDVMEMYHVEGINSERHIRAWKTYRDQCVRHMRVHREFVGILPRYVRHERRFTRRYADANLPRWTECMRVNWPMADGGTEGERHLHISLQYPCSCVSSCVVAVDEFAPHQ